jgi:hypothetical protein
MLDVGRHDARLDLGAAFRRSAPRDPVDDTAIDQRSDVLYFMGRGSGEP